MNFFAEIMKKPWLDEPADQLVDGPMFPMPRSSVGFRIFIVIISFLFTLLVGAYAERLVFRDWQVMPESPMLWLNTAFLLLGSLAMWHAARRLDGDLGVVKSTVPVAAAFSIAFVIGQFVAWQEFIALGYFAAANPAYAFFYMITGLHAVHVLGGLVVMANLMLKVWAGTDSERIRRAVRLCAAYWHFLLIVWLVLFTLFLFT